MSGQSGAGLHVEQHRVLLLDCEESESSESSESYESSSGGPDGTNTICDFIRDRLSILCTVLIKPVIFLRLMLLLFAVAFVLTDFWLSPPAPHGSGLCGLATGGPSHSTELLLNGSWVLRDPMHADLQWAEDHNLSYSRACQTIQIVDVVDDLTRKPCAEWCDAHIGNFTFNLFCGLPLSETPVVTVCLKAAVARYFSGMSPLVKYGTVVTYASISAALGLRRRSNFIQSNPLWLRHRRFLRENDAARLFFIFPTSEGLKQRRLLQKLLFTVAGDILTDLLNVFNLLESGQPFFAAGLLLYMAICFQKDDDVFQSNSVSEWALSIDVGFPTRGFIQKAVSEGWESQCSGLIIMYIVLASPQMSLPMLCTSVVSSAFSFLALHSSFVNHFILHTMNKHPETELDFDRRLELTTDAFKVATERWASNFFIAILMMVAIVTSEQRFKRGYFLIAVRAIGMMLILVVPLLGSASCAVAKRRMVLTLKYGLYEFEVFLNCFDVVISAPCMLYFIITDLHSTPSKDFRLLPNPFNGGLDTALAWVKAAILFIGAMSSLGSLYRLTKLPQAVKFFRQPIDALEELECHHENVQEATDEVAKAQQE